MSRFDLDLHNLSQREQEAREVQRLLFVAIKDLAAPLLAIEYERARATSPDGELQVNTGAPLSIAAQTAKQIMLMSGLVRPEPNAGMNGSQ